MGRNIMTSPSIATADHSKHKPCITRMKSRDVRAILAFGVTVSDNRTVSLLRLLKQKTSPEQAVQGSMYTSEDPKGL